MDYEHFKGYIDEIRDVTATVEILADKIEAAVNAADKFEKIEDVAKLFHNLKTNYTALDDARKLVYHQLDRLDKAIFPGFLERLGVDKIRVPELERSFYTSLKYSVKQLNKEAVIQFLRDNDGEDIISETVNIGTLTNFVKDLMLEQGIEPPEGILELTSYSTIGSSKYKPKA